MTNANPDEVLAAESDGVTVEKSFEPDDFPVPAIAFVLRSDREESVTVRLVDTVPEDVSPGNIGFHPKYGAEFWDVAGDEIVFERELAPGEEYTTVYGLRGDDSDVPSKFLSDPRIESVTPALGDATGGDAEDDPETHSDAEDDPETHSDADTDADDTEPAVDDVVADSDDVEPEADGLDTDADDVASDTDEVATDTEDDTGAGIESGADPDSETNSGSTSAAGVDTVSIDTEGSEDGNDESGATDSDAGPADDDSLVGALIDEIEDADPDDPEIVALRDALGIDLTRATVEARIDHLQSAVSDLEAYTGALEAFLDENGDAQRVLDDVREQYDETAARLDAIETATEDAADSVESIESRVDSELDEIRSEMDGLDAEIESLSEELSDVQALEAEIESLSEELSDVVEMRERLAQALGGIAGESSSERDYE